MVDTEFSRAMAQPVHQQLDTCGLNCPLPLLKAKQALRAMAKGECLRVLATDAGSWRDFRAYAELSGQLLLVAAEHEGVYCYILQHNPSGNERK